MQESLLTLFFVLLLITPAILGAYPLRSRQRIPARIPRSTRQDDRRRHG